ncbi:MAG TPA: hypothetical protein ENO24_09775, partial [Chloroflexi bacterium]|nr:hypothetical protein [Chloroflexota bacterium]
MALASVSVVKSLQNAVYLGREGFDWRLPTLYLAIAAISGPLVLLYRWLAGRVSHLLITSLTVACLAGGLVFFWLLLDHSGSWIYQAFYIWGAIFSVLLPTQGWIFAYYLFTPRTAKRGFVLLGMGGVFGGVFGGFYTALVAGFFTSEGLFLHVLLVLAVLELVLIAVYRLGRGSASATAPARTPSDRRPARTGRPRPVKTLLGSRHLKYLAGLVLLTGLVSTLIDLLYKWSLDVRYPASESDITQFFGALLGTTFLASAVIQLLGTSTMLKRFGIGKALLVLPLGLMFGSLGIFLSGAFWAVVFAKGIDGSLRTSIEQTSVELLYVPVSDSQSITLKSFMELVVVRLGDGIGASLFLLVVSLTGYHVHAIGALILLVAGLWVLVSRGITEEYAQMLRRSLEDESRAVSPSAEAETIVGERTLVEALSGRNPRKLLFVLRQLRLRSATLDLDDITVTDLSGDALSINPSTLYRSDRPMPRWLQDVRELAEGPDEEVAAAALDLLISQGFPPRLRDLKEILCCTELPDRRYLIYLSQYSEHPGELLDADQVLRWSE